MTSEKTEQKGAGTPASSGAVVELPAGLESAEPRPKEIRSMLGGQEITIKRLGTRDGLAVAQHLLRYIDAIREPLIETTKGKDLTDLETDDAMEIGMKMLNALMIVLEDEALLKVLSRLIGQPQQLVGDAPLEDTMNALADALSINDMPMLLKAASRIWEEAVKMGARL